MEWFVKHNVILPARFYILTENITTNRQQRSLARANKYHNTADIKEELDSYAAENPEFPHYLTIEKFREYSEYFAGYVKHRRDGQIEVDVRIISKAKT